MNPIDRPTLVGTHVRLEPLDREHVTGLVDAATVSRDTFRYSTAPADRAGMQRYVDAALELAGRGLAVPFTIVEALSGTIVGSTRFASLERWIWPHGSHEQRPVGYADAAEIGWTWLSPRAQRTPINTEAKLLMLGHAFGSWALRRVWLKADARNTRSRDAILRIGATQEGIIRNHSPGADGVLRDTVVFSVLPVEWPGIRERLSARLARG